MKATWRKSKLSGALRPFTRSLAYYHYDMKRFERKDEVCACEETYDGHLVVITWNDWGDGKQCEMCGRIIDPEGPTYYTKDL